MKTLLAIFALLSTHIVYALEPSTWVFVPADIDGEDDPWRLSFQQDHKLISERLFAGVRSEREGTYEIRQGKVFCELKHGFSFELEITDESLIRTYKGTEKKFVPSAECDDRFEKAPKVPRTKKEAIGVLFAILPEDFIEELSKTKKRDLIDYHFSLGLTIRNAFELWEPDSPLMKNLGGSHPDEASMKLIVSFWKQSKKKMKQNQLSHTNPASAPR